MIGWLRSRDWHAVAGLIRIEDDLIERIRRRIHARLGSLKIAARTRDGAESEITEAVRWEIVAAMRDAHPGRDYQVRRSWPLAFVILTDDGEVMVRIWIGQDYADNGNGISPIRTTVNWRLQKPEVVDRPKPLQERVNTPAAPGKQPVSSTAPVKGGALDRLNNRRGRT